jgi:hypothetical protein
MKSLDAFLDDLDSSDFNMLLIARRYLRDRLREHQSPIAHGLDLSRKLKNKKQILIFCQLISEFCTPEDFILLIKSTISAKTAGDNLLLKITENTLAIWLNKISTQQASQILCDGLVWTTKNKNDANSDLVCEIVLKVVQRRPHPEFHRVAEVLEAIVAQERQKKSLIWLGTFTHSLHVVVPYEPTLAELLLLLPESDLPLPATAPLDPDDLPRPSDAPERAPKKKPWWRR